MQRVRPINKAFYNSLKYFITTSTNYKYDISSRLLYLDNGGGCYISHELYQRLLKLKNENTT